jgi:nucleoside-diphosphate-sugar epimerase
MAEAVLVFGGSGWIGGAVCRTLTRRGLTVVVGDLRDPGDGNAFVPVDVADPGQVLDACRVVAPAAVVNLAYLLAPATEADIPRAQRINLDGMVNVFEGCRQARIQRCVFASSIAVYGDQSLFGHRLVTEDDRGWPAMLYGWHKLLNEASAACFERDHGVESVALRLSTAFGPGPATINHDLNELIADVAAGGRVESRLPAATELNLIHVDDAGDAFAVLATAPTVRHRVYNSGGEHVTLQELSERLVALRPGADVVFVDSNRPPIPRVTRVDWSRLKSEFGLTRPPLERRLAEGLDAALRVQMPAVGGA